MCVGGQDTQRHALFRAYLGQVFPGRLVFTFVVVAHFVISSPLGIVQAYGN